MYVKSLKIENFRNYDHLNIEFDQKTTILYGNNAQGKTNILEAVYYLAAFMGFRCCKIINSL